MFFNLIMYTWIRSGFVIYQRRYPRTTDNSTHSNSTFIIHIANVRYDNACSCTAIRCCLLAVRTWLWMGAIFQEYTVLREFDAVRMLVSFASFKMSNWTEDVSFDNVPDCPRIFPHLRGMNATPISDEYCMRATACEWGHTNKGGYIHIVYRFGWGRVHMLRRHANAFIWAHC